MDKIQEAINYSRESGLIFFADYMIGAPWETKKEIEKGFNRLLKLTNIPYVYLPVFTPMPGTPLWKYVIKENKLIKKNNKIDWSKYNCSLKTIKLNYNTKTLREKLEQKFYTTKKYKQNVIEDIKKDQKYKQLYYPIIKKMSLDYPKNKILKTFKEEIEKI
jgi:radical SAM superfamily enzyme YgiQ (UPF0313 family)